MTREQAMVILGIDYAIAPIIGEAFRKLSKTCHPDGPTPDRAKWDELVQARDTLLAPPPRCPDCKGTGRVKRGNISVFCTACDGAGRGQ